jgi:hypothetical protein
VTDLAEMELTGTKELAASMLTLGQRGGLDELTVERTCVFVARCQEGALERGILTDRIDANDETSSSAAKRSRVSGSCRISR